MRIDPKYFNSFLVCVAVVGAIIIALFTYSNLTGDERIFKERMMARDSLKTVFWHQVDGTDSLRISDFDNRVVVLDFWTDRSKASVASHEKLAEVKADHEDKMQVIAAAVGMGNDEILKYAHNTGYDFRFVSGSEHFSSFHVPAVPVQLVYNPDGDIHSIFVGYRNQSQYDSLRAIIKQGRP